jgi:hypothetical protein
MEGAAKEKCGPRGEKSSPIHEETSPLFNLHDTLPSGLGTTVEAMGPNSEIRIVFCQNSF